MTTKAVSCGPGVIAQAIATPIKPVRGSSSPQIFSGSTRQGSVSIYCTPRVDKTKALSRLPVSCTANRPSPKQQRGDLIDRYSISTFPISSLGVAPLLHLAKKLRQSAWPQNMPETCFVHPRKWQYQQSLSGSWRDLPRRSGSASGDGQPFR